MGGNFSDLLRLFKNEKKPGSFDAHLRQYFDATESCTDLLMYMMFKLVKQINPIGATKTFTKPNCNLCTEDRLTILKIYVTNVSRL